VCIFLTNRNEYIIRYNSRFTIHVQRITTRLVSNYNTVRNENGSKRTRPRSISRVDTTIFSRSDLYRAPRGSKYNPDNFGGPTVTPPVGRKIPFRTVLLFRGRSRKFAGDLLIGTNGPRRSSFTRAQSYVRKSHFGYVSKKFANRMCTEKVPGELLVYSWSGTQIRMPITIGDN